MHYQHAVIALLVAAIEGNVLNLLPVNFLYIIDILDSKLSFDSIIGAGVIFVLRSGVDDVKCNENYL